MEKMPSFKKTRIAPTPSGYLHLGNVLSFALTAGLARQTGAGILLRIDDLDKGRVSKDYIDDIFDTLHFLRIPWNEGPRTFSDMSGSIRSRNAWGYIGQRWSSCGRRGSCLRAPAAGRRCYGIVLMAGMRGPAVIRGYRWIRKGVTGGYGPAPGCLWRWGTLSCGRRMDIRRIS